MVILLWRMVRHPPEMSPSTAVSLLPIVYATLIIKGRKTLAQVPALIKTQVEEILADLEVEV